VTASGRPEPYRTGSAPRLLAGIMVLVGLLDIAAVLRPGLVRHLEFVGDLLPGVVVSASAGVSVAVGVLLLGLAHGVARGKRRAWRVTVALVSTQVALQAIQRHWLLLLGSLTLLVLLLRTERQFVGRSHPLPRRQVALVGASLVGASVVVGLLAVGLLAHEQHAALGAGALLVAVVEGLVGVPSVITAPESPQSDAVYYLLISMSVMTIGVVGYLALLTARTPPRTPRDDAEVRSLVTTCAASDSLAYFATRDDRAVVWSETRGACVTYKVVSGTALAAGDPVGPRPEWPAAITAFLSTAAAHAWVPAAAATSADGAQSWNDVAGFAAIEFGDEAVLDRAEFSLAGRPMRNVRQAAARAERAGNVVVLSRLRDLDDAQVAGLRADADRWRGHGVERGFSMSLGRIDSVRDPDSLAVWAEVGGRRTALLVFVPWSDDGLSLDVMRRSPTATNGVTELMITTLMSRLDGWGLRRVSLNFAVFRDVLERADSPQARPWTRAWGRTVTGVSRWSQAESLYRFTSKFHPTWQPRYLVYRTTTELPRVALSYLDAESFVPRPRRWIAPRA
jgi:lysyl-tRNA synthetase class 2